MHPSASTERAYGFMLKPESVFSVCVILSMVIISPCGFVFFLKHGSCVKYSVLMLDQLPYFLVLGAVSVTHFHFWKLYPSGSGTNSSHRHWSLSKRLIHLPDNMLSACITVCQVLRPSTPHTDSACEMCVPCARRLSGRARGTHVVCVACLCWSYGENQGQGVRAGRVMLQFCIWSVGRCTRK